MLAVRLLNMIADPASGIAMATPKVMCRCGNTDPKRWTLEDRPVTCTDDVRLASIQCDCCKRHAPYYETLGPEWAEVCSLVRIYLAKHAAGMGCYDAQQIAAVLGPRETVEQRLRRLRDDNLRGMFQ